MGSVRNPVGPLPSTIYWRRRAVLLCLLALVVAIVLWAVNSGGGGGDKGTGTPAGSHSPAATITAGPAPSGTHISGRPGGRDTSPSDGGASSGGAGDGGSDGGGSDGGSGATTPGDDTTGSGSDTTGATSEGSAGTEGSAGSSGTAPGSGGTSSTGGPVPVGSTLPDCAPGTVTLALTSTAVEYSPGDTPAFQLRATNSSSVTCKLDFGPRQAVFTVTPTSSDHHVWASDDCPNGGSYLLQVPAHATTTFTLHWNEKSSSPQCATPKAQQAAPGTYLVQVKLPGYAAKQASFRLTQD